MVRLYGKPTKYIRHHTDQDYTIEPERGQFIPFWYGKNNETRTDGEDKADNFGMPLGSRITKHKVDIQVTPETIEPQQIYIGRIKLSFHDSVAPQVIGTEIDQTSYQTGTTGSNYGGQSLVFWVDKDEERLRHFTGDTYSAITIQDLLLDDRLKHFLNLKKVTVFDQRPIMGSRWQKVPAKVKRINPYTWYGMLIYNDSTRGATPADTQIKVNVKQYIEEWAI